MSFFFQAEDGIRDGTVTGVQTCALPISPPEGLAADFTKALFVSHYFYAVAVLQIVGGAILLIGRFVPLGLTLLGPVIVNILLFHIFLEPKGLPIAIVFAALTLVVLCANHEAFKGLLKP